MRSLILIVILIKYFKTLALVSSQTTFSIAHRDSLLCNSVFVILFIHLFEKLFHNLGCNYMVCCTLGIHPHFVEISSECNQIGQLADFLASGNFVGVGEAGVDYTSRCACGFCYDKKVCLKVKAQRNFLTE